eukprot:GCRY01001409.1.p1 GENE.GCRY01001409.1~~GCRY01001409.1.p1  ORF type:complete len:606 (+),score=11.60 GCRY01001409.1:18-1835(+)
MRHNSLRKFLILGLMVDIGLGFTLNAKDRLLSARGYGVEVDFLQFADGTVMKSSKESNSLGTEVLKVSPDRGSTLFPTSIVVRGHSFFETTEGFLKCKIGDSVSAGVLVNSTAISCSSSASKPYSQDHLSAVSVSFNAGLSWITADPTHSLFLHEVDTTVSSLNAGLLNPTCPAALKIEGSNFRLVNLSSPADVLCSLKQGNKWTDWQSATIETENPGRLSCTVPALSDVDVSEYTSPLPAALIVSFDGGLSNITVENALEYQMLVPHVTSTEELVLESSFHITGQFLNCLPQGGAVLLSQNGVEVPCHVLSSSDSSLTCMPEQAGLASFVPGQAVTVSVTICGQSSGWVPGGIYFVGEVDPPQYSHALVADGFIRSFDIRGQFHETATVTLYPTSLSYSCAVADSTRIQCTVSGSIPWGPIEAEVRVGTNVLAPGRFEVAHGYTTKFNTCSGTLCQARIYHSSSWRYICDDYFDSSSAGGQVYCRGSGFLTGDRPSHITGTDSFWLDNVQCTGGEAKVEDCAHAPWGSEDCGSGEVAAVRCYCHPAPAIEGATHNCGTGNVSKGSSCTYTAQAGYALAAGSPSTITCGNYGWHSVSQWPVFQQS